MSFGLKMFAFHPHGHGPLSFFVLALNEDEAWNAVLKKWPSECYDRPSRDSYDVSVLGRGQVEENCNE